MSGISRDICKQEPDQVLLVEGTNDCHVVLALCAAHAVPEAFGLYECGGDVAVLRRLNALISSSTRPKTIGVVLDADRPSLEGRWDSIKQKLSHYNYSFPSTASPDGTIIEGDEDEPKLGFWLMPNNQVSGMKIFVLNLQNQQHWHLQKIVFMKRKNEE